MPAEDAPRNSVYWLDKAEEARTRAEGLHDATARESLLKVSSLYDLLARRAADREAERKPV
jgi:hypothetical protein